MEIEGVEEYEVEEILDSKFDRRRRANENLIYTVKWIGYSDPTEEPEVNLSNALDAVRDYHTRYPSRPGPHNRPGLATPSIPEQAHPTRRSNRKL